MPTRFDNKLKVRYIYVSNYTERSKRCSVFDIAILTEDYKYAEYEIRTRKVELTPNVQDAYQSLMADWQLTCGSKVYFHESVAENEPVRMLFKAVSQQMKIVQRNVTTDGMMKRLCHIHENFLNRRSRRTGRYIIKKTGDRRCLNKVWRKVVERRLCPWITKEYDDYLTARGYNEIKRRKRILRLGMYYICESNVKSGYDGAGDSRLERRRGGKPERAEEHGTENASVRPDGFETGIFS